MVNGEYAPGQQIPTEQELMKQYNVSRITVRLAIQELINEKYLIKSQGKGAFVSQTRLSRELVKLKSFTEGCEDNHQVAKSQVLSVTVDKANKHDISRLGVSAEDKLSLIHISMCIRDRYEGLDGLSNVFREDEVEQSYPLQEILQNVGGGENGYFPVHKSR